ncbi:polysaccharide deacetylase family protein [Tabrizicola sp. YIM 78059]|uniref:polysaccharide deacetylase family protein n=1 Tax=Tabrizicola sp. YIM 78059 TaxID=2529861 RepID=UPI00145A3E2F|nr:polysaccharide deacetylase family protein [Tabrizicola sp. YIM 78059]
MTVRALLVILAVLLAGPGTAEPTKGLLTITFDDASRAQFDHGLRLARAHGLPGTLFVPTGLVGDTPDPAAWTMTWDEVRAFNAAGWEIGAHGRTHVRLPDLPPAALSAEIDDPVDEITEKVGVAPVSFSSPFGAFTDATVDRIMASYRAHLSWKGHGGRNPRDAIEPRFIGRLEVVNTMTAAQVCGEMVASARDGTWLVLLFHGITEGPPGDYEVSAAMMDEIFSCAAFLRDRGVIEVATVRDALASLETAP